jgi:hypothetical protein
MGMDQERHGRTYKFGKNKLLHIDQAVQVAMPYNRYVDRDRHVLLSLESFRARLLETAPRPAQSVYIDPRKMLRRT